MKIIHAHKYFYERAGAERYMFDLMELEERAGHTVAPFCMHYPKNKPSPWSEFFVSELRTEDRTGNPILAFKQLKRALWSREAYQKMARLLDAFEPDVVHIHNIYTHLSPSILQACSKHGVPVVMTVHDYALLSANYALWTGENNLDPTRLGFFSTASTKFIKDSYSATLMLDLVRAWHDLTGAYANHIDHYFCSSDFVRQILAGAKFAPEKMSILYPFIGMEDIPPPAQSKKSHVLFMGRLEKYKGVQTLISAMKYFPTTILKIAGSGNYEQKLREQARGLNNIEFVGWASGKVKDALYAGALVGVVPSLWQEPAGIVMYEAMVHGVPVIVADKGGMPEIVEDGVSGRVFKAGNEKDLVRVLREFIERPLEARAMGEAARTRALELGNADAHLAKVFQVYKKVVTW